MPVICLTAGLGWSWTAPAEAASAPPSDASAPVPIQRPEGAQPPSGTEPTPAPGAAESRTPAPTASAPEDSAATPPPAEGGDTGPAAGAPATSPDAAETAPSPGDAAAPREVPDPGVPADRGAATAPTSTDGIDPQLLGGASETAPAPKPVPTPVEDPDQAAADADEALARAYAERFRPAHNPGRFNLEVRTLFANAGGRNKIGGRMGGVQVDLGQSWNRVGYALTVSGWGGRVFLPEKTNAEMNAMFGVGPTVNLGRLALLGRGYLDLRVGYDFFYGVVNKRRDSSTVVAPQGTVPVTVTQAQNLTPHGPRVQLQMGLLVDDKYRRYIHGFGVSAGWQALVGSFRGDLPFTNMLTLGFSYWMG